MMSEIKGALIMESTIVHSVNTQDAFVWTILAVAPVILTIVIHVMLLRKMAYFKERPALKWVATFVIFIILSFVKPFVAQALFKG